MEFAGPLCKEQGVATRSNIRVIPTNSENGNNGSNNSSNLKAPATAASSSSLDGMLIEAANKAAVDLFLGPNTSAEDNSELADGKLYPEHVLPTSPIIEANSLVVVFESFDNLNFVYATPGAIFSNRNGHFAHDDFIGKPFGCKIRSCNNRGLGFLYLLRPTAELWARSLNHRTQIVHELDASMIVFYLHLRPNMVVCESGTGSGAMSHAIIRTIAPKGRLHTFEFNQMRAERARDEFAKNKCDHLVTVHHRDVCGKVDDGSKGGFGLGPQAAHAIFLDLPEPWLAVPHAAYTLKPNGRLASYSPCVEQTQRTIIAMRKAGFHSFRTIEVRLREHFVDEVELELPPKAKLPRGDATSGATAASTVRFLSTCASTVSGGSTMIEYSGDDTGAEADNELTEAETAETEATEAIGVGAAPGADGGTGTSTGTSSNGKRKRMVCARPFATMRGHTAFLTFCTVGNKVHPDPNDKASSTKS
mmetsp:Transcript_10466/g.14825  ORF Transcript_10466/g.14825 Transcript_10466/m.14825 type:complete len:476 (+) Transcript_10466:141-1568(+)